MLDVSIVVKDHPSLSVLSVSLLLDVATSSRHLLMRETEKREIEREREAVLRVIAFHFSYL